MPLPRQCPEGKDAPLEQTVAQLTALLAARGFSLEETQWLNPVEGCWSLHLRDRDCPLLFSNGKGSSKLAARASALGEFVERASTGHFWSQIHFGRTLAQAGFVLHPEERWFPLGKRGWPRGLLSPELRRLYDPQHSLPAELLVEHHSANAERGICALPHTRQRDGAVVWFPATLISTLYVSNGLAAGNTPAEARVQALSEIFERHVKYRVLREALCLPEMPAEQLAAWPRLARGLAELRAAGFGLRVLDASLDGRYPVAAIVLSHPSDHGCYASFGAHPRQGVALERALTELLQGRALDALAGFPPPCFDPDEVADPQNLEAHFIDSSGAVGWALLGGTPDFAARTWDFGSGTEAQFATLCELLHREGHEVYIADLTPLGAYACRILVPGVSEIYPIDDLAWENTGRGNHLRPALARLPECDTDTCANLLERLDDLDLPDDAPIAALIGLAPDPDSPWATLRAGELRTLLALASGDRALAADACAGVVAFGQLPPERLRMFRALEALLRLPDAGPFAGTLRSLFGDSALNAAAAILDGRDRFAGLHTLGGDFEASARHRALIAALHKVRAGYARP